MKYTAAGGSSYNDEGTKMKTDVTIKRVGPQTGTIGWLTAHADHIKITAMGGGYPGCLGAWLVDVDGKELQYLASRGGVAALIRNEYPGKWTDAAWRVISDLADQARTILDSDDDTGPQIWYVVY